MASQTLSSVADVWPVGTSVGAYVEPASTAWNRTSSPPTAAVATASVAVDGSLVFSGLADGTAYVAYAAGRAKDFWTPVPSGSRSLVIDAMDYGVIPGAANDSTAGLQAALDAAEAAITTSEAQGTVVTPTATVQLPLGYTKVTGVTIASGVRLRGQGMRSRLYQASGANRNLIQSKNFGSATVQDTDISISDVQVIGNWTAQAAGQAPTTKLTTAQALSGTPSTLTVIDTTNFPSAGGLWVGYLWVTYTGKTGTTFTGCTISGSAAITAQKGSWITRTDPQGNLIALQCKRAKISNVFGNKSAAHGLYLQGPNPIASGLYAAECHIDEACRFTEITGNGVHVGQNCPDGQVSNLVTGGNAGGMVVRSDDWGGSGGIHFIGNFDRVDPIPFGLLIAASKFHCDDLFFDTYPGTLVVVDCNVQGYTSIDLPSINRIVSMQSPWGGALSGGQVVLFRGVHLNANVSRATFGEINANGPFTHVLMNAPYSRTIGTHNLATASKLQVANAMDFADNSTIGGVVSVSTDSLSYTGKTSATTYVTADTAIGATTLPVNDTTSFDSSGTATVFVETSGSFASINFTYTGKTATSFTGIPSSGAGSITSALVASPLYHVPVSQHFLTGITGGALTSVATDTTASQSLYDANVSELNVPVIHTAGLRVTLARMLTSTYIIGGGSQSGKGLKKSGTASIAAGSSSVVTAHGLFSAPTVKVVTPTADTQGRRWWATADATNITITLDATATTNPITFDWRAEVTQ